MIVVRIIGALSYTWLVLYLASLLVAVLLEWPVTLYFPTAFITACAVILLLIFGNALIFGVIML